MPTSTEERSKSSEKASSLSSSSILVPTVPTSEIISTTETGHSPTMMSQTFKQLPTVTKETLSSEDLSTSQTINLSTVEPVSSSTSTGPTTVFTTKISTEALTPTRTEETGTFSTEALTIFSTVSSTSLPMTTTSEVTTATLTVNSEPTISPELNTDVSSSPIIETISTTGISLTTESLTTSTFSTLLNMPTSTEERSMSSEKASSLSSSSILVPTGPTSQIISTTETGHSPTVMSQTVKQLPTETKETLSSEELSTSQTINMSTVEPLSYSTSTGPTTVFTTEISTQAVTPTGTEETGTFSTEAPTILSTVSYTSLPLTTTSEVITETQTVMSELTISLEVNARVSSSPIIETISTTGISLKTENLTTSKFSTLSNLPSSSEETSMPLETASTTLSSTPLPFSATQVLLTKTHISHFPFTTSELPNTTLKQTGKSDLTLSLSSTQAKESRLSSALLTLSEPTASHDVNITYLTSTAGTVPTVLTSSLPQKATSLSSTTETSSSRQSITTQTTDLLTGIDESFSTYSTPEIVSTTFRTHMTSSTKNDTISGSSTASTSISTSPFSSQSTSLTRQPISLSGTSSATIPTATLESVVTEKSTITHEFDNVLGTDTLTSLPLKPNPAKSTSLVSVISSNPTRPPTESSDSTSTSNDHSNVTQHFSTLKPIFNFTKMRTSRSAIVPSTGKKSTPSMTSLKTTQKPCTSTEYQQCLYINGTCSCVCNKYHIGGECEYGKNQTSAFPKREGPIRNMSVELKIDKTFDSSLNDPSSDEYVKLHAQIESLLEAVFKRAAPAYFWKVVINGFRSGSIIVNSTAIYAYPNNQTGIDFINQDLQSAVNHSLEESLPKLAENMTANVSFRVQPEPPALYKVEEMKTYVNCSLDYAGYTVTCNKMYCYCTGPCFNDPGYCHRNGECFNAANGSVCQCYKYNFYQFRGERCEIYERTSGFYGLIFGVIGGVLLLVIVLIFAVFVLRKKRMFDLFTDRRESKTWFRYDEERTNFQHTDMNAFAAENLASFSPKYGKYDLEASSINSLENYPSAGVYRPRLDKVETSQSFHIQRPEMVPANDEQR